MKPTISIIVPIYNVEQYLEKCVDSICRQTMKDIEIILVDDGSKDRSGKIADELAKKDDRIVVYHKENGGLSDARNYGISRAKADLIGLVDSDDYIDEDMYETLYNNMIREDADLSMCALLDVYPGVTPERNKETEYMVVNSEEAIRIVLEAERTSVTAVNKLYKKKLFDQVKYPVGRVAEDAFVIVKILHRCKKIVITTEQKYYYIHRQNSITTAEFKPRNCDVIDAYKQNYKIIKKYYPNLLDVARMRLCWANFYILDQLCISKSDQYEDKKKEVVSFLRKNYRFIMKNKNFHKSRKAAMSLLMISDKLYKLSAQMHANMLGINH